jgi:hypothetical protein
MTPSPSAPVAFERRGLSAPSTSAVALRVCAHGGAIRSDRTALAGGKRRKESAAEGFCADEALRAGERKCAIRELRHAWESVRVVKADVKADVYTDRIYDPSFGVKTDKGTAPTVDEQWENDRVKNFCRRIDRGWIGSNPAGKQLSWS